MADLFGDLAREEIHVLQLWQPWASAVALGSKRIETRDWETDYRGPLAISATARCVKGELADLAGDPVWCGALGEALDRALPFGAIIAVCRLVDCRPTGDFTADELDQPRRNAGLHTGYSWTERQMGDYSPGRFGLVLSGIHRLPKPLPFKGRQAKLLPAPELNHLIRRA